MKRTAILITAAALVLTGLALAQGPRASQAQNAIGHRQPAAAQAMRQRAAVHQTDDQRGFANANGPSALAEELQGVVAEALGLSQDELQALKQEGASIADIAADQGVPIESVEAAYEAARSAAIDQLLADGTINDVQAEQMANRGVEAFATLVAREGCAEGQNVTGERLYTNRATEARGMQAQQAQAQGAARGRHARW